MASVKIHASTGSGQTLAQLADIISKRMQYMGETARGSIAACMLNVLRSLRTVTLVAKPKGVKVELKRDSSLQLSYFTRGKDRSPCLRVKGSNVRYKVAQDERFRLANKPVPNAHRTWQIYRFTDEFAKKPRKYIIASPSATLAKQYAKDVVRRRMIQYAGLARKAISTLMQKTFNKSPQDNVAPHVARKAYEVTRKSETVQENKQSEGGTYTLTLYDDLMYATDAFRGGKGTVDTQMKKAMNKIVATINRKIPDGKTFFGPQKIPTPFPEVVQRRKK